MSSKRFLIVPILLLILLSIGFVSASDNGTDEIALIDESVSQPVDENSLNDEIDNDINSSSNMGVDDSCPMSTKIASEDVTTYYKENSEFVSYLKDSNNQPISNKRVSILINSKIYDRTTDVEGKIVLKLNLKPGTYCAKVKFDGDENYTSSIANAIVKVNKATLAIQTKNFKTYFESGFYLKAKVINKVTKNPVQGVKVAFKVLKNNKYKTYYATTDSNGIAKLKKNFNVGSYKVVVSLKKNAYLKAKKTKAVLTIKETAEMACSSLYLQVSNTEAVAGFRRDATNAKTLHIVKYKLNGKLAVKQYKTDSYFFHSITTADGWMAGTGGWDNPVVNHAIENLAGKIIKSGKITKYYLKKIQRNERKLNSGHFSIKAPNGKYAIVWASGIKVGKLKPGEFIDVPNARSMFRHGTWTKYSNDPAKAAIKVAATDSFGVNRRDATAFHWKATTVDGKTSSTLKVYAANDNGRLVGKSTGHLKDNIIFKGKFISKNSLPKTPSSKFLGTYKFGSIDKLIKTQTTVKASKLNTTLNESKTFEITVKDKKTKKPIKGLKLKLKIKNKVYTIKTDSKGVARFNPKSLGIGNYNVLIYSGNLKYFVSVKSTIIINNCT
ncbi:hypothetical protein [Methanobrevibacter thaueri]|uniref:Bacterial Ig-like domain (Group 1) n=1 Tax=Methanobrevibacter thaueri TaxID=190975 RepID=A0A315XKZ9_9EURY|nr:hypothetical protein [Methanobrevibacter thaueri]PWB86546.1 bacterial Ig-like domain (group 1) [Methanobrevibacter thaueri]